MMGSSITEKRALARQLCGSYDNMDAPLQDCIIEEHHAMSVTPVRSVRLHRFI